MAGPDRAHAANHVKGRAALRHACERLSDEDLDAAIEHARAGRFENAEAPISTAVPPAKRKGRKPTSFGSAR